MPPPTLSFSHFGFFVRDLERMVGFYTRLLGFTVSDRGELETPRGTIQLAFLTRDPREHHQIVLASGRPEHLPFNPINQISFRMQDFGGLREMYKLIQAERGVSEISPVSHGNALSVYFRDPEGNRIELFVDTPWYVVQPLRIPMDMTLSDEALWQWAKKSASELPASSRWKTGAPTSGGSSRSDLRRRDRRLRADGSDARQPRRHAGLAVAVLEREAEPLPLPRAVHFDGEVARVFETAGLAASLAPRTRPSGGMRYVNTRGEIMIERKPALATGAHGWPDNNLFHQPDLEAVLRAGAARFPNVRVFMPEEVLSLTQKEQYVILDTTRQELRARWVVGCDGARSAVRQAIGAEHDDLGLHQPWLVVDVLLEREVDLPEQTVQYCDPARPVTFVQGHRQAPSLGDHADARRRCRNHRASGNACGSSSSAGSAPGKRASSAAPSIPSIR